MPRKPVPITSHFPYHIRTRSNNREWFYLPIGECWKIYCDLLVEINARFRFETYAFVLMNNHTHHIGSAHESFPIPMVYEWFQRSATRTINRRAGRINHLFGGPYRPSLITSPAYYKHAYRYVYRNPVTAKIVERVEDYKFSSLTSLDISLSSPASGIASLLPRDHEGMLQYLNEPYLEGEKEVLDRAMRKPTFKIPSRLRHGLSKKLK